MIAAIVAVDENWGIGNKGELLLKIPDDLKRFRQLTEHNTIIMGRKTYSTLPPKGLPFRHNLVVSNSVTSGYDFNTGIVYLHTDEVERYVFKQFISNTDSKIFIIGGSQTYNLLLKYCDTIYLTKIFHKFEADAFFPNIDMLSTWNKIDESLIMQYSGYDYQYLTYKKLTKYIG